jgi:hypothetical protein
VQTLNGPIAVKRRQQAQPVLLFSETSTARQSVSRSDQTSGCSSASAAAGAPLLRRKADSALSGDVVTSRSSQLSAHDS